MSKPTAKRPGSARGASPKIRLEDAGRGMSSQAGLVPVVKFLDALGFGGLFGHHVEHTRAANALYQLGDAAFLVVVGLIGGARSLSQCMALWSDEVLRRVAGWQRLPDQSTLGRVFKEVRERHVSGLETLVHALRQRVWARALRAGRSHLATQCQKWIDADSTVKTVYGRQQGTAKGDNPHKRGARSYHPLLAFCSDTKEIVQAWLRTGSAYTSNGMVAFMQQLLAQFPAHHRLILRADSGFFDGALLDLLDARGHGYLIKVKMRNLAQLLGQQRWTPIHRRRGWEQCEFSHRAGGWSRERFFLAVRCPQARDADHPQGELLELECYDCFCYVSTEPLSPWLAHRTYGQRATSETWIEEAKSQMGLAHLKTVHFLANAALFQCAVLAYNTLRWMALLSGNAQLKRWEPQSIRLFLIRVAGKLLTGANQLRIKLARQHLHARVWEDWLALSQPL
jgi:hypothetical protein